MDIIFLIGRILLGGYFLMMGVNHFMKSDAMVGYARMRGIPSPKTANMLAGLFLALGGAGIVLGFAVEIAVILIVVFLLLASFGVHHFWTDEDEGQRMNEQVNFMKNMALIGALLMILEIAEPWVFSI